MTIWRASGLHESLAAKGVSGTDSKGIGRGRGLPYGGLVPLRAWLSRRSPAALVLLGLTLREALSPWTGHPYDMELWVRTAYHTSQGLDPYQSQPPVPGLSFAYLNQAIFPAGYLPLWPLILASLYHLYSALPLANRFFLYFILKQLPILGDVGVGCFVYRLVGRWGGSSEAARRAMALWMLLPYSILISSVWGMFDAMVASLVLLSLVVVGPWKGSGLLGVGILLKFFPVIFLPYVLLRGRWIPWWGAGVALALPALFTFLALRLPSWGPGAFWGVMVSMSNGGHGGLTYMRVLESPALAPLLPKGFFDVDSLAWLGAVIAAALIALWLFREETPRSLVSALLLIATAFFLTRWGVNEQYLLYLLPLLLIDTTLWHPERRGLFHTTWILGTAFLMVNNLLLIRFLAPVLPGALSLDMSLDSAGQVAYLRYRLLDLLGVLFSLHMLQLALVVATPRVRPKPWLLFPLRRLKGGRVGPVPGP